MICDICKSNDWIKYSKRLVRCGNCKVIRANKKYSNINAENLYQHDYYFGKEYCNYLDDRKALEKNFTERLSYLIKNDYLKAGDNIIEVGCAYGFFLNLLKKYKINGLGYDLTKEGVEYAKKKLGVRAICGDYLKESKNNIDAVFMWDVIEHLEHPDKFIKKTSGILKTGGILVLTTGDIGSLLAKLQGDRWRLVHPPTHLFYFDKYSIEKILGNNGFRILKIRYTPIYRSLTSVIEQTNFYFVKKILNMFNFHCNYFGINTYDIMEVLAIKK